MRLLLDQGLPRSTVEHLHKLGIEATHVGELGLATASDERILKFAVQERFVVATLDGDFHALLAMSKALAPSVVRIRIEGLRAESLANLLKSVLEICADDLERGAMVSVTEGAVRMRRLPMVR